VMPLPTVFASSHWAASRWSGACLWAPRVRAGRRVLCHVQSLFGSRAWPFSRYSRTFWKHFLVKLADYNETQRFVAQIVTFQ
jgi:hypothetical protein